MLIAFLLQVSLLTHPVYLEEEPPELRSLQHIVLLHRDVSYAPPSIQVSADQALEFARELHAQIDQGADFTALATEHSQNRSAAFGGVLGSFAAGMLAPALDDFLFSAEIGAVSEPIATDDGVHILRRVETYAGVLQIMVAAPHADARARCAKIRAELAEGLSFADAAKKYSDDKQSAQLGGQFQVFTRGPEDRLLKRAAFELAVGETSEPIESPLGWHILRRVSPQDLDPLLVERTMIRVRAILVGVETAPELESGGQRPADQARELAYHLYERIVGGEPMELVAREFNDDTDGRKRAGDLGWIYRRTPLLPAFMQQMFARPVGWLSEPVLTTHGYLILRRER